jgi:hypothetical protein
MFVFEMTELFVGKVKKGRQGVMSGRSQAYKSTLESVQAVAAGGSRVL